jgi:serine/threonine-protein kinase
MTDEGEVPSAFLASGGLNSAIRRLGGDLVGRQIGAYHVTALLGAGGMGEVYRARDTKLGRDVALKVLPAAFTADADRLARFEREARTLASLNHPHIGAIYGFEEAEGIRALVLELVEGETLADLIARHAATPGSRMSQARAPSDSEAWPAAGVARAPQRGSRVGDSVPRGISINEALSLARQIAEALEAAHDKGIIHRDLKPANITIARDGTVKVLDFGLAKAVTGSAAGPDLTQVPTSMPDGTATGLVVGTVAYMSPEQARGQTVDERTDIWAFGCVLYEMLTGRAAFAADTLSDTMAAVMRGEPDWRALPGQLPATVQLLLRRCLHKNPRERLHDIADARLALDDAGEPATHPFSTPPNRSKSSTAVTLAAMYIAGLASALALWLVFGPFSGRAQNSTPVARLTMGILPADELGGPDGHPSRTSVAVSPDGRTLAFSAVERMHRQIYTRQLNDFSAASIADTDGGSVPFFSPDGEWIGFWASGELKKVPARGGVVQSLSKAEPIPPFGASWGADGRIVFARASGGLWQVSADGGVSENLTSPDSAKGEVSHRLPHVLPDGSAVLFTITRNRFPSWSETDVAVYSRRTGETTLLIKGGADARYAASGHVVYLREGALLAAPFSLAELRITGGSVGVAPDVMQAAYHDGGLSDSGAGQFGVSSTGTLAYISGGVVPEANHSLVLVDRSGKVQPLPLPPGSYRQPRLSPDGSRLAVATRGRNQAIWVAEIGRGGLWPLTRETERAFSPVWTPDGTRIIYRAAMQGPDSLFWRNADGSGTAEPLTSSERNQVPGSISADGEVLAFYEFDFAVNRTEIRVLPMTGDRKSGPLLDAPGSALGGVDWAPNGRWFAYHSSESGQMQVFIREYPGLGGKQLISTGEGMSPVWRRDNAELFYVEPASGTDTTISVMSVTVSTTPALKIGSPRQLFSGPFDTVYPARGYDVAPGGDRFLMVQLDDRPPIKVTQIRIVQNWFEELRRLVPTN